MTNNQHVTDPNTKSDRITRTWNTDPANKSGNPYQRFPERATWEVGAEFERHDGSRYTKTQMIHRWAGEYAADGIVTSEVLQ